jgi:hypothetical protein
MQQNPAVMRRLRTDFVPVAINLGTSGGSHWLVSAARAVNPNTKPGAAIPTMQGYYIIGADGTGYAYYHVRIDNDADNIDSHESLRPRADRLLTLMDESLERFRKSAQRTVNFAAPNGMRGGVEHAPDPTTFVVRSIGRLTTTDRFHPVFNMTGRDHYWIYAEEARALIDVAQTAGRGSFELPRSLVRRLVRFHLTDTIRGVPRQWVPEEVRQAAFAATVEERGAGYLRLVFNGSFELAGLEGKSGYRGKIGGEIDLDPIGGRLTRFRAYAEGPAWGRMTENEGSWRRDMPIRIAFMEETDEQARLIAPMCYVYGLGLRGQRKIDARTDYRSP